MRDGGFLMLPVLGLGLAAIVAAARRGFFAAEADGLPDKLARATLAASMGGSLLGRRLVLRAAQGAPPVILLIGPSEALCPAVLGLLLYAVATLISTLTGARVARGGGC